MTVYFVYRSHYYTPTLNRVVTFAQASVLEWFQQHWSLSTATERDDKLVRILGGDVYGFDSVFEAILTHHLPAPSSEAKLHKILKEHLYVEGELKCKAHCIQVLTDDDELQMAYYFFDDHYLAEHSEQAALLLRTDWQMPTAATAGDFKPATACKKLQPRAKAEGTLWLAFLAYYSSSNLDELEGPWQLDRARLPDLVRYLLAETPPDGTPYDSGWPRELYLLQRHLQKELNRVPKAEKPLAANIAAAPGDSALWQVYGDWLEDHGQGRAERLMLERALRHVARDPGELGGRDFSARKSLIQVDDHVAQLCLHTDHWDWGGGVHLYHRWIFFDDLWASANPALAQGVLRYAKRWDVLS